MGGEKRPDAEKYWDVSSTDRAGGDPAWGRARAGYSFRIVATEIIAVQSLSRLRLCDLTDGSMPDFLSFTISGSLLKLMSTESVMPFNHLVLCRPLLLLPSIFPSIRVFSRESAPRIRWPKYWNFSISISHRNYHQPQNNSSTDYLTVAVRPRTKRSVARTAFLRGVSRGLSGAWPVSAFMWGLWGELAFSPTRVIDRIECHVGVGRGSLFPPAVSQSCSRLLEAAHIYRHTMPSSTVSKRTSNPSSAGHLPASSLPPPDFLLHLVLLLQRALVTALDPLQKNLEPSPYFKVSWLITLVIDAKALCHPAQPNPERSTVGKVERPQVSL